MKTSIVTGGAGFIGSNLAKQLIQKGDQVYIFDDLSTGFMRNVPEESTFHHVDISNLEALQKLEIDVDIHTVFHLAAQSSGEASFDNPSRDIDVNYKATYNILKLAQERCCKRFIYASSMSVYGEINHQDHPLVSEEHDCNPISYYGCNKLASEKLIQLFARQSRIAFTNFRLFNVYGPGQNMCNMKQGMLSIYMSYIMKDLPIVVKGSLDRFRDFIYVEDVVEAMLKSENLPSTYNQVYNLGTGVKTTVYDLLKAILQSHGKEDFDQWVTIAGNTPGDIKGFVADTSKWRAVSGWTPRFSMADGLRKMKQWIDETMDWWKD